MTRISWGDRPALHESGLDQAVLYLNNMAVAWSGLLSVEEKGGGETDATLYFDSNNRRIGQETGVFEASIKAYTYPDEFDRYTGYDDVMTNQDRDWFGLCYRTQEADGYRLNLVYNARVLPGQISASTVTSASSVETFSWDIHTTPVEIPGAKNGSHLVVRTYDARYPEPVSILEDILYGTETTQPRLPMPSEIIELFESYTIMRITYNWDGTWTATGPDNMVYETEAGTFEIVADTVLLMEDGVFQVSSY